MYGPSLYNLGQVYTIWQSNVLKAAQFVVQNEITQQLATRFWNMFQQHLLTDDRSMA